MANFPNKVKIPVAAGSNNVFDLSQRYVGTLDFGNLLPVNYRMCYPREKYDVKPSFLIRCSPLVVPSLAGVKLVMDSFFVPYHTIFENWSKFLTRESYVNSSGTAYKVEKVPYFGLGDIQQILQQSSMSTVTTVTLGTVLTFDEFNAKLNNHALGQSATMVYDFCGSFTYTGSGQGITTGVKGYKLYKLTDLGRRVYNLFVSLGYPVRFGFDRSQVTGTAEIEIGANTSGFGDLNALPLLAYVKIFIDRYQSNQFTNDSSLRKLFDKIRLNNYGTAIPLADLASLVSLPFNRCYSDSLYTSTWLTPNADADVVNLASPLSGDSSAGGYVSNVTRGAYVRTNSGIIADILTNRLQNFIDRWRIGGKRFKDRMLSEFGVTSRDADYHYSRFLHSFSSYLQVSQVLCTNSDPSQDVTLGEYGGLGVMGGKNHFTFETGIDYGIMMTICSLVPETGYPYGVSKELQDVSLFDFYTPEFDSVGVEAVEMAHITQTDDNFNNPVSGSFQLSQVFGYVPRYSHHKVGHDTLAGDFRIGSTKTGQDSWHLFRADYKDKLANNEYFRQIYNAPGSSPRTDGLMDNYDRIFAISDGKQDNFKILAEFQISASRPMRSIAESLLPIFDGDNHKDVVNGYNGSQL